LQENDMAPQDSFVRGMSSFAIDLGEENIYTPAAPQGVNGKIVEK
jgi:hypothetical protein